MPIDRSPIYNSNMLPLVRLSIKTMIVIFLFRKIFTSLNSYFLQVVFKEHRKKKLFKGYRVVYRTCPVSEFNEFKPRLKSPKNRFQLSAGLNLKIEYHLKVEPTKFEPRLKFFKFGLRSTNGGI